MTKDTVNIHGKQYETVASRVSRFRDTYGLTMAITTELIERDADTVVMKASIVELDDTGKVLATGYAEENRASSTINRTSALENCETSAIGRALAAFGMAGTEYASADEVAHAIDNQSKGIDVKPKTYSNPEAPASDKQKQLIAKKLKEQGIPLEDITGHLAEVYGVTKFHEMTMEQASFVIEELLTPVPA